MFFLFLKTRYLFIVILAFQMKLEMLFNIAKLFWKLLLIGEFDSISKIVRKDSHCIRSTCWKSCFWVYAFFAVEQVVIGLIDQSNNFQLLGRPCLFDFLLDRIDSACWCPSAYHIMGWRISNCPSICSTLCKILSILAWRWELFLAGKVASMAVVADSSRGTLICVIMALWWGCWGTTSTTSSSATCTLWGISSSLSEVILSAFLFNGELAELCPFRNKLVIACCWNPRRSFGSSPSCWRTKWFL